MYNTYIIRNMNKLSINNNLYNKENTLEVGLHKEIFNKFLSSNEFETTLKNHQNSAINNILLKNIGK